MRRLQQPGPATAPRIEAFATSGARRRFPLAAGLTLNDALTAPLRAAGFRSGSLAFSGAAFGPFSYVMPNPSPDALHVAYFSPPRSPAGVTRVERASATFGWRDGAPFVHCHAVWIEPDGTRRGGHVLPHETIVAAASDGDGDVDAWGCADVAIVATADPETNFPLFRPDLASVGQDRQAAAPAPCGDDGRTSREDEGLRCLVARVRPNEDICTALETLCREQGWPRATVRGVGSLIGARFMHGGGVEDHATEVLVREGRVTPEGASLDLAVVDMQGRVHEGVVVRGDNPVCITFEAMLVAG